MDLSPQARESKGKTNYRDYPKIKSSCMAKKRQKTKTINKAERQPTEWKKIFTSDRSGKGSISKIKNLYNSTPIN